MGIVSSIIGLGASIGGYTQERNAAKKSGQILVDRAHENMSRLEGAGERGAQQIEGAGQGAQADVWDAVNAGNGVVSDTVNRATEGVYDSTRRGVSSMNASLEGLNPYIDSGTSALAKLNSGDLSTFINDPSVQFRIAQGTKALNNNAASKGLVGGNLAKGITDYSQGVASDEYGKAFTRAKSLADLGLDATGRRISGTKDIANFDLAGNSKAGDILTRGGEVISGTGLKGAALSGDFQTDAAVNAAKLRYGSQSDVAGYNTEAGNAEAGSIIGRSNAFNNLLGNVTRGASDLIDSSSSWLNSIRNRDRISDPSFSRANP